MTGWIYDHRKEIESDIWLMPPLYHRVWQYLKYKVNHSTAKIPNRDGTTTTLQPGQHATSYRTIANGVGYYEGAKWKEPNSKTIKVILDWMVKNEMITIRGNTNGTIVTIANWETYQKIEIRGNARVTLGKHSVDTKNECKRNDNNDNKDLKERGENRKRFIPPEKEEVMNYCKEKGIHVDADRFINFYASKGWMVGKNKMKDWKAAVRGWASRGAKNGPQERSGKPDQYAQLGLKLDDL